MDKIKQLEDVDTSKCCSASCPETGMDAVILDIDKVDPKPVKNITEFKTILKEVIGAKLIFMEPIGGGADFLEGVLLYFMFPNGDQRAIAVDPPLDSDCIKKDLYSLDHEQKERQII